MIPKVNVLFDEVQNKQLVVDGEHLFGSADTKAPRVSMPSSLASLVDPCFCCIVRIEMAHVFNLDTKRAKSVLD